MYFPAGQRYANTKDKSVIRKMVHSAAGVWGTEVSILALATSNFVIILSENFIFFKSRAYNKSYDQPTPDTFHNRCSNIVICFFFGGNFLANKLLQYV